MTNLATLLSDNLNGGSLVLDSSLFDGQPLAELIDSYFDAGRLTIRGAVLTETDGVYEVRGEGSLLGIADAGVVARFREIDGEAAMILEAERKLLDAWTLSSSFPGLGGCFLDELTFRHPKFVLDSHDDDPLPEDFQVDLGHEPTTAAMNTFVKKGLHFEGELELEAWTMAAWLLNGERVPVRGPVEVKDDVARMRLEAEPRPPAAVGHFELPMQIQVVSFFAPSEADGSAVVADAYVRFLTELSYDAGGDEIRLPLGARFDDFQAGQVTLEADLESVSAIGFEQLEGLLDGNSVADLIPEGFPSLDRLRVTNLHLALLTAESRPWRFMVDLSVEGSWTFFEGCSVSDPVLRTTLYLDGASSSLTAAVLGTTAVGNASFHTYVAMTPLHFHLSMAADDEISLERLMEHFGLDAELPGDLRCRNLEIAGHPTRGDLSLQMGIEGDLEVEVGSTALSLDQIVLFLDRSGGERPTTSGVVSGTVSIGGVELRADWRIPGSFILTGRAEALNLGQAVDEVCGDSARAVLPGADSFLDIDLTELNFELDSAQRAMTARGTVEAWGEVDLSVQHSSGATGFGAGLRLRQGFRFSDLADELSLLDGIEIANGYLLLSTFAFPSRSLPNQPHGSVERVEQGINLYLPLRLSEFPGVEFLANVIDLDVEVALRGAFSSSRELLLEASLAGFEITKGVEFQTVGFRFRTSLGDVALSLFGTLLVTLEDQLTFTGEVTAEPTGAYLSATMDGTWNEPFGIKGFILSDVALQVGWAASGLPAVGVAGTAVVGGFAGSFAVLLNSVDPIESVLQLRFDELTTEVLFEELMAPAVRRAVPARLRELLAYGYRDVDVHLVPESTRIGQIVYEQGFRLQGKTAILGIEGEIDARLDYPTGLEAEGRIDRIRLARVPGGPYLFALTDAEDARRGPAFEVNFTTISKPFLRVSGRVAMLGFFEDLVLAEGGAKGLSFRLQRQVWPTEARLDCTLGDGGLAGSGRLSFDLNFSVNVKIPGTDTKLGRVEVKSRLVGRSELEVGPDDFLARVTGSFEWRKQSLSIPEIEIRTTPRDMDHLLRLVVDGIKDNADELFGDLLGGLEDLANAVAEGVVTVGKAVGQTAEDVGKAIADAYGATADEAAEFFTKTDFSPSEVGGAMKKGFVDGAEEAARVLKGAGYASKEVGKALKGSFSSSANTVAKALKEAGFGSGSTANALKGTFTNSTESAAKALKAAGFKTSSIGRALKGTFSSNHETVGKALKAAGCGAKDTAKVLKNSFNKGSKNVARHFKREWNKGDNGVKNLLKDSGFSKNNVKKAMEDVFNWGPVKFVTGWF